MKIIDKEIQNELFEKIVLGIKEKKEAIIVDRLRNVNLLHLIKNIENQRFKRLICEKEGNEERWYADNGTDDGLLLVVFILKEENFDIEYNFGKTITIKHR